MKFGELAAILFMKEEDNKFILTSLYPDVEDDSFLFALTMSFTKEKQIKEHNIKVENEKNEKIRDDAAFMDFLITNVFDTKEKYEEFLKEENKEEVVKKLIKIKKKKKIKEYKGITFEDTLNDLEEEFSNVDNLVSEEEQEEHVVIEKDIIINDEDNDLEFENIMASMDED